MRPVVLVAAAGRSGGGLAEAAALAVAVARRADEGVLVVEITDEERRRRPTLLASDAARDLERAVRAAPGGGQAVARGSVCWLKLAEGGEGDALATVAELLAAPLPCEAVVVHLPPALWAAALDRPDLAASGGLVRADLDADRELAAIAVAELRTRGMAARVAKAAQGPVAARRSLAGLEAGAEATARAERAAKALVPEPKPKHREGSDPVASASTSDAGQSMPLVLGAAVAVIFTALLLTAIGGAITGKGRVQRAADLAALSAVRSMRDDFDRLLAPARLPNGAPNPRHLSKGAYLARATAAGREAADRNGVDPRRVAVEFPDAESFAPVRARADVEAELDAGAVPGAGRSRRASARAEGVELEASATAEATAPADYGGLPEMATGGGYSGPLVYRQGEGMRPDVAAAFDRMAAAARRAGLALVVNSGFRSDEEQAALFAANPNPTMVAPPGQSLHRCGTELDLGPPAAYGWLASNARRFGFVQRYSWEAWHYGFVEAPAPCSAAGDAIGAGGRPSGDGEGSASGGLPAFVPGQFRAPLLRSAARWNVSAALLAAQIMAESNFNPLAVSPAGAQGIAQFMPGTAASYGLHDPFDAPAAIDAQAHLMSDLLKQFRQIPLALAAYNAGPAPVAACGCVPPYPETKAYVARILGLLDGAGEILAPPLEVRLVA
jgi:hypothetical protein